MLNHKCSFFLQFIILTYSWDTLLFKKIIELGLKKHWDFLSGHLLTLWYIQLELKKNSDYLTGLQMILYVGTSLEKYSNYLTAFALTLSVYDILHFDLANTQH